jgi:hypothetical protein
LKEALAPERPQVVDRDRRRDAASHLARDDVDEIKLRVEARKDLGRIGARTMKRGRGASRGIHFGTNLEKRRYYRLALPVGGRGW